jgi:hypothetical protein
MGKNGLPPRQLPGSFAAKAKQMAERAKESVAQRAHSPDRTQALMPDISLQSSGGIELEDIRQFEPLYPAPSTASAPLEAQQNLAPRPAIAVPSGSSRLQSELQQSELQQSRNLQREIWARKSEPNPPPTELPPQPYYPPQAYASAPGHASPYDQAPPPAQPPIHQSMGGQYPQYPQYPQPVNSYPGLPPQAGPPPTSAPQPMGPLYPQQMAQPPAFKYTPEPAHCIDTRVPNDVKQTTDQPAPQLLDWLQGSNSPDYVSTGAPNRMYPPVDVVEQNPHVYSYTKPPPGTYAAMPPQMNTQRPAHVAYPPSSAPTAAGRELPRGWTALTARQPNGQELTFYRGVGRDVNGNVAIYEQYEFPAYPLN